VKRRKKLEGVYVKITNHKIKIIAAMATATMSAA
jgi:hypothetical protein